MAHQCHPLEVFGLAARPVGANAETDVDGRFKPPSAAIPVTTGFFNSVEPSPLAFYNNNNNNSLMTTDSHLHTVHIAASISPLWPWMVP